MCLNLLFLFHNIRLRICFLDAAYASCEAPWWKEAVLLLKCCVNAINLPRVAVLIIDRHHQLRGSAESSSSPAAAGQTGGAFTAHQSAVAAAGAALALSLKAASC